MQSEPVQSAAPPANSCPPVLSDEEFDAYCDALAQGHSEAEILAAFGINRREYWRVQCAANRRRNREAWAQTRQFRESSRRHEKREALYEHAMQGDREFTTRNGGTIRIRKPFRSLRAVYRWMRYNQYDKDRPT